MMQVLSFVSQKNQYIVTPACCRHLRVDKHSVISHYEVMHLSYQKKSVAFWLGSFLGVSFLTALSIYFIDQPLSQFFAAPEQQQWHDAAWKITDIGLGAPYFILTITLWFCLHFVFPLSSWSQDLKNKTIWLKAWSKQFFWSLLVSGLFIHIVKFTVGRQRPHLSPELDPWVFEPFNLDWHFQSFPSGHTQVMFIAGYFLVLLLPKLKIPITALAVAIAFTRVMTQQHFLSDVLFAAFVAFASTQLVLAYFSRSATK